MALRKVAQPEDIAAQVVVLSSDVLSGHVSGELVTVAGGMEGRVVHDDGPELGRGRLQDPERRLGDPAAGILDRRLPAHPRVAGALGDALARLVADRGAQLES